MKFIIVFLMSFNCFALTVKERMDIMGDRFRLVVIKSGLNQPNLELLKKSIVDSNDLVKLSLLESNFAIVESELKIKNDKILAIKALKLKRSEYNCEVFNDGYTKDSCFIERGIK